MNLTFKCSLGNTAFYIYATFSSVINGMYQLLASRVSVKVVVLVNNVIFYLYHKKYYQLKCPALLLSNGPPLVC